MLGRITMPKAYFMVRSVVEEALRQKFDQWYSSHHLPMALSEFRAEKCWRLWSAADAGVHYAVYQFADMARLDAALKSDAFKGLVKDFDEAWPGGVSRTRDMLNLVEERSGVGKTTMAKAYLVVRSVVEEPLRQKFDHWYSSEHLPRDIAGFKCEKGWRFWSAPDPSVHYAVYRFADMARLEAARQSDVVAGFRKDFDEAWPSGVTRTRDVLNLAEERNG
jgi:hypothetical protein